MFDNLTLEELLQKLRSMTADQLKIACKNWIDERTKRQLIILIMALKTLDIDNWQEVKSIIREGDTKGQTLEVDEIQDVLGNKIRSYKREWSYYPGGEVDIITITEMNENDVIISTKQLKHYLDGKQPKWL